MYNSNNSYNGAPSAPRPMGQPPYNSQTPSLYPTLPQGINPQAFNPSAPQNSQYSSYPRQPQPYGVNQPPTSYSSYQQPGYPTNNQPYQAPPQNPGYPNQQSGYPTNNNQPYQAPPINPGYPTNNNQPYQAPPLNPGYPTNNNQPYQVRPQNPGYPTNPSYPGANSMGYQYGANQPPYNNQNNRPWDERMYLKTLFDEIDHNHDGEISKQELHEALKRGQTAHEFDPYTVTFLLEKYDGNHDNEISFQEFHDLYVGLNIQFNEFLDIDQDSSGFIDGREFGNAMRRKGYNFSQESFEFIVGEISRRSGKHGITFDIFVRVIARFDFLRDQYNRSPYKNVPLEKYIRDYFF